jgi:hypothetical protein
MPEIVSCPTCDRELRVPDELLGQTVRCPKCQGTFTAQVSGQTGSGTAGDGRIVLSRRSSSSEAPLPRPPIEREEEDEDHPRREGDAFGPESDGPRERRGWGRTRLGLTLFIIGIYVFLGACLLGVLGAVVGILLFAFGAGVGIAAAVSNGPNSGGAAAGGGLAAFVAFVILFISYLLLIVGSFVEWILQSVGQVFFLWVPHRVGTGRRPLAIATVVLWFAQLALTLFSWGSVAVRIFLELIGNSNASTALGLGNNCLSLVHGLCGLAWFFVFMFLLRSIARACGNERLERTILIFTIIVPVFGLVSLLGFFGLICGGIMAMGGFGAAGVSPQTIGGLGIGWLIALGVFTILFLVIYIALWVWWVVILHQARGAVTDRLNESD